MATRTQRTKAYQLRVGRLADGREAFAKAGYYNDLIEGETHFAEVWVRDPRTWSGGRLYQEAIFAPPGSANCRRLFSLVKGKDRRVSDPRLPDLARIPQQLGWNKD